MILLNMGLNDFHLFTICFFLFEKEKCLEKLDDLFVGINCLHFVTSNSHSTLVLNLECKLYFKYTSTI